MASRVDANATHVEQTSWFTQGSRALCGAVAIESAVRAIGYLAGAFDGRDAFGDFTRNVGGVIYMSMAAVNVLPGIARVTAVATLIISGMNHSRSDAWVTARVVGPPVDLAMDRVIVPALERIGDVTFAALNKLSQFFGYNFPKDPVWPAIVVVSIGAAIYRDPLNIMPWSKARTDDA